MTVENEVIELDIDSDLLTEVSIIAETKGLSPEEYIVLLMEEYVKSPEHIIRQGEMAELFANGEPYAEPDLNR